MNISKNSWHYRWMKSWAGNSYGEFTEPRSLCAYFWTFVGAALKFVFIMAAAGFFISLIPLLLWSWLANGSRSAGGVLGLIAGTVTGFGLVFGFIALKDKYVAYLRQKAWERDPNTPATTTEVAWGVFKAFKSKVCPLINYVE